MTKQLTYDQTKETNRIEDKKIEKIADFFCQILQWDYGCDFFGCFDAIIRCDIFPKKTCDAIFDVMRLPSLVIIPRKFIEFFKTMFTILPKIICPSSNKLLIR